jgi:hypothetical protein
MVVSRHQNAGKNGNLLTVKCFENVAKLKYSGTTVTIITAFTNKLRTDQTR